MDSFRAFCRLQCYGSGDCNIEKRQQQFFLLPISPCGEFSLLLLLHFAFLCSVVVRFAVSLSSPAIDAFPPRRSSLLFAVLSAFVCAVALLQLIVSPFPSVLLIAYSLVAFIWAVNALFYFITFQQKSLSSVPSVLSLSLHALLCALFALLSLNRWLFLGPSVSSTLSILLLLSILFCSVCQFVLCLCRHSNSIPLSNSNVGYLPIGDASSEHRNGDASPIILLRSHEHSNWLSKLFFCWTNPLLRKGFQGHLSQVDDVFHLPPSLHLPRLQRDILGDSHGQSDHADQRLLSNEFSFAEALFRAYGRPFLLIGVVRFTGDAFRFASPILLHLLITSLQESSQSVNLGYVCAALMSVSLFVSSVCDFQFNYYIEMITLRAKSALLLAVYQKLLRIPAFQLTEKFSSGNLINLMSSDVDRVGGLMVAFHAFWSMPINFAIALYLLYREVGMAFLAGVLVSLLLIPLNKYIASKVGQFSNKMMQMKDARVKLLTELSRSMRTVKLNNWTAFFEAKIGHLRSRELANLKGMKYLDAVCVYLWASAPTVIMVLMLVTYSVVLGELLTAAKVFTTLSLISILIMPLNAFPWVLSAIINGMVSKRRFDAFFAIRCGDQRQNIVTHAEGGVLLGLDGNSFAWNETKNAVSNVHFNGKKGMLIGVIGPVGCGKTSLLMGLLGETIATEPYVRVNGEVFDEGFAFVGQDVWLREGTIRENVLCERPFDQKMFQLAVDSCALSFDIQGMPGKENYRISGDGITLSGGQKLRLALARAVYAEKRVFLLDDPFAALDRTVAEFVHKNCLLKLKEAGKLIILCTHHERFLSEADLVIRLNRRGEPDQIGSPDEVLTASSADAQSANGGTLNVIGKGDEEENAAPMDATEFVGVEEMAEEKEVGAVKIRVYVSYVRSIGVALSVFIILSLFAMQMSKIGSDIWLSRWASAVSPLPNGSEFAFPAADWSFPLFSCPIQKIVPSTNAQQETNFYLFVYIGIAALNTICTLIRAFLYAFGCILAAKRMHERILNRILNATLTWWDRTPCGRVTNRPFVLLLIVAYFFLQRYYRRTTVELRRIAALSLSPLYSHLAETVSGLVSIRAFRITHRFSSLMCHRLEGNVRALFSQLACYQWLAVRTQMLGVAIVSVVAFASVFDVHFFHLADPGLIGLSITYALSFTALFNGALNTFVETEKELVSVERICDYLANVPEEIDEKKAEGQPIGHILGRQINGQIRFVGVSLRYASDLPLAIRDVSFHVDAGRRVAIIGRTGSGKSTILQALLRAVPLESGKIFVDEVIDLDSVGLDSARSLFGFCSQHPFLFSGTLRENLCLRLANDSSSSVDDQSLLNCISSIGLGQWLDHFGGLSAEITEGGRNLSFGERQLISLLRLALSNPRIILIDEATAHMDENNHKLISQLIARMGCTVLAILHRTSGLTEFDWIIEMSNGQIARQGHPSEFFESEVAQ
ncbi:hypothetical protein niasHT_007767 [Heterodera trifolii]|uniref:ABC-type xenobiotic transporter n=1 Tax=Heterodera trifolii TaxID=157864 RepID=A0ABD2LKK6_9BILA